ncbi:MAG TPA: hypothetical protein V6D17_00190 [Candidatus Obscuribacterales bacterium]
MTTLLLICFLGAVFAIAMKPALQNYLDDRNNGSGDLSKSAPSTASGQGLSMLGLNSESHQAMHGQTAFERLEDHVRSLSLSVRRLRTGKEELIQQCALLEAASQASTNADAQTRRSSSTAVAEISQKIAAVCGDVYRELLIVQVQSAHVDCPQVLGACRWKIWNPLCSLSNKALTWQARHLLREGQKELEESTFALRNVPSKVRDHVDAF